MTNLFITILNISITATYIALAVMLARLLLKRSPKWISCLLWAIVAIRLLVPFSVESRFSLIPEVAINNIKIESVVKAEPQKESNISSITPTQPPDTDTSTIIPDNSQNPQNNTGNPESPTTPSAPITPVSPSTDTNANDNKEINKIPVAPATTNTEDDTSAREKVYTILSYVCIGGTALMLVYCTISFLHLRKKVQISLETEKGIFICDNVNSPFILGIIRPKIYLPSTLGNEEKAHIIAHEKAHLKRCDHLWKPFGFILLSLHWFNPIMWLAYILLCRDIEFACDEKVMKSFGNEHKKDYSKTLFECSIERKVIAACPLAFGEVGVKQRIKNVLNYKRPAFWVTVTALVLCVAISLCFLTNPVSKSKNNSEEAKKEDVTKTTQEIDILNAETSYNINATELIYDNPLFSYTQEAIDAPTYRLVNCSQLQEVSLSGSGYNVKLINDVYVTSLHYDAFKKTFVDYPTGFAEGYSVDLLHNNNESSVDALTDTDYYQLLKQKDNTHYLVVGHVTKDDTTLDPDTFYNSTDAYTIPVTYTVRWIYKVELTPAEEASMVLRDPEEGENSIEFLYQESLEEDNQKHSHLTLYPVSKTFDFSLSVLSSYYPSGNYKIRGNKLILECNNSKDVYVFRILGSNSLEFIAGESSELPKYKYSENDTTATPPFEDGARFISYGIIISGTINSILNSRVSLFTSSSSTGNITSNKTIIDTAAGTDVKNRAYNLFTNKIMTRTKLDFSNDEYELVFHLYLHDYDKNGKWVSVSILVYENDFVRILEDNSSYNTLYKCSGIAEEAKELFSQLLAEINPYYTLTRNDNYTYTYEVKKSDGTVIESYTSNRTPYITIYYPEENMLSVTTQEGTGTHARTTKFYNITTGKVSDFFWGLVDYKNGLVASGIANEITIVNINNPELKQTINNFTKPLSNYHENIHNIDFTEDFSGVNVTYYTGNEEKYSDLNLATDFFEIDKKALFPN